MRTLRLLTLALLMATLVAQVEAAPFENGSFELGPSAPVHSCIVCGRAPYIGTFSTPFAGIPGWTVTAGSIDIIFLPGWAASEGARSIDLDGLSGGTLTQTFDTIPGTSYEVSFDLAANFYAGATIKSVLVTAPGFSQTYTFDSTGRTALDMGWRTETFEFVAVAGSSSLSFDSQTNSAFGAALDNVRVSSERNSVPEPATFVLMGLGLVGVGVGVGRRTPPGRSRWFNSGTSRRRLSPMCPALATAHPNTAESSGSR